MSEDFGAKLSRWSQRKQAARRGAAVEGADDDAGPGAAASAQETPQTHEVADARQETAAAEAVPSSDEETPALPPIDELTAESDYTVFMRKSVPEALKRAALRKLWVSDPVLANLDRLNDYDDDYSIVDTVVAAVRTSYQVGKGHVDEIEDKLAKLEPAKPGHAGVTEPSESPDDSAAPEDEASRGVLGDNDAVGDEPGAAARQVGETEPGEASGEPAEDKG